MPFLPPNQQRQSTEGLSTEGLAVEMNIRPPIWKTSELNNWFICLKFLNNTNQTTFIQLMLQFNTCLASKCYN